MTLLIRQHRKYEQVYYEYESQFSCIVKSELRRMLPDFFILDFSPYIIGDEGIRRKPDLALIDRNYSMWAVVEVELDSHSLKHHVLPQIRAFTTGRYDDSHANLLYSKDSTLSLESLNHLVTFVPPVVSVIVNSRSVLNDGWDILESNHSARLTFLESFRSVDDDIVFSLSGYIPAPRPSQIIGLKKHKMLNALVCIQPLGVPAMIPDKIRIFWRDRPYVWPVLRTKNTVLFLAPGGFNVRADRNYEIRRIGESAYHLFEL